MSSSHIESATTATRTPGHSPKSAEQKAQDSLTLNGHLYAAPNVIERLSQGATSSKKTYRAQATTTIVAFDEAFQGMGRRDA
ncbi:hypothetical protein NHQ30_009969 [Ciborinia camelliae]|nr:hypothetical protein NHQ30_009969 [Ciborinia camelliae]